MKGQKFRKRIAMTADEVDTFLAAERTCRLATVGADAVPHVTPLWFVWHDGALWLYSLNRSKRWNDILRNPRVAVLADGGHDFAELRGVELVGTAEVVGEVPRTGEAHDELAVVEQAMADKYFGGAFGYDGRHGWLKITPDTLRSWDHRKAG